MFEVKNHDAMGRIGILKVKGKKVETPLLLPVVNPRQQLIPPAELFKMGFPGIITNSYIIYKDELLRRRALKGIHGMLDFDGLIMTDSGSFQLFSYGNIDVDYKEIVSFQNAIGADIGVILDIPSAPDASFDEVEYQLRETLKRAAESVNIEREMLLAGTVQGGVYSDLRRRAASEMAKLGFDVYPIGGVVPLMEEYRFPELVKVIMACKEALPPDKPVHLFGCGHPMIFGLAVACGCDIFDSAAYALYARDGRYITPNGTRRLTDIQEFPCSCDVCSSYSPQEIAESEDRETLLSRHNLYASLEEMRRVKESIRSGSLFELIERRCRSHPMLLDALRVFYDYDVLQEFTPITKKSAFFYSGPESLLRPEVKRHLSRVGRVTSENRSLVLLPETEKPFYKSYGIQGSERFQLCVPSPVFGVIPLEVEDIYPLNQHEKPQRIDRDQEDHMIKILKFYCKGFNRVLIHSSLSHLPIKGEYFSDLSELAIKENLRQKAISMADYQFGKGSGEVLFHDVRIEKAKTGKIRRAVSPKGLVATFRASDGLIVPTLLGAERLLRQPAPANRVIIKKEAAEFVAQGRSVFARFVVNCDRTILPSQEVVIVDEDDILIGTGKAVLSGREMISFEHGVAVKTRHHTT